LKKKHIKKKHHFLKIEKGRGEGEALRDPFVRGRTTRPLFFHLEQTTCHPSQIFLKEKADATLHAGVDNASSGFCLDSGDCDGREIRA